MDIKRSLAVILVAILAAIVIGNVLVGTRSACAKWQKEYRKVARQNAGGVFDFINQGPTAELEKRRPDNCPKPKI